MTYGRSYAEVVVDQELIREGWRYGTSTSDTSPATYPICRSAFHILKIKRPEPSGLRAH